MWTKSWKTSIIPIHFQSPYPVSWTLVIPRSWNRYSRLSANVNYRNLSRMAALQTVRDIRVCTANNLRECTCVHLEWALERRTTPSRHGCTSRRLPSCYLALAHTKSLHEGLSKLLCHGSMCGSPEPGCGEMAGIVGSCRLNCARGRSYHPDILRTRCPLRERPKPLPSTIEFGIHHPQHLSSRVDEVEETPIRTGRRLAATVSSRTASLPFTSSMYQAFTKHFDDSTKRAAMDEYPSRAPLLSYLSQWALGHMGTGPPDAWTTRLKPAQTRVRNLFLFCLILVLCKKA